MLSRFTMLAVLVVALAAQVYGSSVDCSSTDDSCTLDVDKSSLLQTQAKSSASLDRLPEDALQLDMSSSRDSTEDALLCFPKHGKQCAKEGGTCKCAGFVRYGLEGKGYGLAWWSKWIEVKASTECGNAVFGDPAPWHGKACECADSIPCSISAPDELANALRLGSSSSGMPQTVKEKLKALNKIAGKSSPKMAEHNEDLITADDLAKVVGEHAEDHGCSGALCHQGDMQAADAKQLLLFQQMSAAMVERGNQSSQSNWVSAGRPWAKSAVQYCFAADIDDDIKHLWELATKQVKRALPCMSFENVGNPGGHKSGSADEDKECKVAPAIFVQSSKNEGCWSYIGMLNPPIRASKGTLKTQLLNLKPIGCALLGTVIHELGHALGMAHEQSRPDRGNYVKIHWENIKKGTENNFRVDKGGHTSLAYDYLSLMHYGSNDFSTNDKPTITTVDGAHDNSLGQRIGLSQYDADQLQATYHVGDSTCLASKVDGNKGCEDKDSTMCAGLAKCSTQDQMEKCCGCGGGTEYQCWTTTRSTSAVGAAETCKAVAALPIDHAACILDKTSAFGGRHKCVTQNACDYTIRVKCQSAPGVHWNFKGPSGYTIPPFPVDAANMDVCGKKCTVEKV